MSRLRRAYEMAAEGAMGLLPTQVVAKLSDECLRLRIRTQECLRRRRAARSRTVIPEIRGTDGDVIRRSVLDRRPAWRDIALPPCTIPGMLSDAEKRYYTYLARFYSGAGAAVEIGPWLGLSTYYLVTALKQNPHFSGRKLHVYDDFVWRSSWMSKWLAGTRLSLPANHASFQDLFMAQISGLENDVVVHRMKVCDYDGNESLPPLDWTGGPIELLIVDCGRTLAVNEAWWQALSHSFITDRTLIVMEDWQAHKAVPEVFWENTRLFTDSKTDALDLVHELRGASAATFLYRGQKTKAEG